MSEDYIFLGFKVHYFNNELGIQIPREKPIENPTLGELVEIISKFSGDDSLYMSKDRNIRVAFEKMPYGFFVAIESHVMMYKECSYEKALIILESLLEVMKEPLKHGFILEGTEPLSD